MNETSTSVEREVVVPWKTGVIGAALVISL